MTIRPWSRLVPLALALVVLGAGRPAMAQTPLDSALYAYIRSIKAVDNHSHVALPVAKGRPADTDFDALPVGNLPPYSFPIRLTSANPMFVTAWREMFDYRYDDRTPEHLQELLATKERLREQHGQAYPAWVADRLGFDVMLVNRLAVGPGLEPPRFRWVPFADPLLFPLDSRNLARETPDREDLVPRETVHLKRYLKDLGRTAPPATLAGYVSTVVIPTLERWHHGQAVAIKYEIAYLRSLEFKSVSEVTAARIYAKHIGGTVPTNDEYLALQDYLFRRIALEAGRLGLVVQLHAFDSAGGYFRGSGSDPLLLESVFNDPALRKTRFLLIHGGWPYPRHTLSMFGKPNVYADFSFLGNVGSPAITAGVLREWLTFYPDRVLFGSDAYPDSPELGWEEWGWLGSTAGRQALAMALTGMMRDGEITAERARELGRMVMRENAIQLYGLKAGHPRRSSMAKRLQAYEGNDVQVSFDPNLCIHSAVCLRSLPAVFDVGRHRWIDVGAAPADAVVAAVAKCPSGALQVRRAGEAPTPAGQTAVESVRVVVNPNGPLGVRGGVIIEKENGEVVAKPSCSFCRCGASKSAPFCDGSHRVIGFRSPS